MQRVNNESNLLFDQTIQFDTHRDELITTICKTYYKIRFFHEVRKVNDKITMRSKFIKLIHFRHE